MSEWHLGPLTALIVVFVACSSTPKADDPAALEASATAHILSIPPANAARYQGMADMKNWRNPYLIINTDSVALLDSDNHEEHLLKPEQLTQALANLPPSAWPYGRVVAVTENGVRGSSNDDVVKIRKVRAIVAGTLEDMHVAITWIPSA